MLHDPLYMREGAAYADRKRFPAPQGVVRFRERADLAGAAERLAGFLNGVPHPTGQLLIGTTNGRDAPQEWHRVREVVYLDGPRLVVIATDVLCLSSRMRNVAPRRPSRWLARRLRTRACHNSRLTRREQEAP